jgi:HAD superfamily hydrolase (TIGR01549 family)
MADAVIFDMDGTLIDSVDLHARAWQDALKKFGKIVDFPVIREQIGKGGDQILPLFLTKEEVDEFGDELTEYRGKHFKAKYIDQIKPFPKVRELFEKIKEDGKKIAIGSSAKAKELDHYMKLVNVADLVDVKTCADDTAQSKPHPDIFEVALEKLQCYAQQTVVIGDSPYDAEAARKINIPAIGVLCGGFSREILEDAGTVAIYGGPADILGSYAQTMIALS